MLMTVVTEKVMERVMKGKEVMIGEGNQHLEGGKEGKEGEVNFQDVLHRFLGLEIGMIMACLMVEISSHLIW